MAAHQERMSRMLLRLCGPPQEVLTRGGWVPAVDIYSNGQHELVLKAELPDMREEEIELAVEGNTLTLRGEKRFDTEVTGEQCHDIERSYSPFGRTFALPPTIDGSQVSAEYKAGVLTVRLPPRATDGVLGSFEVRGYERTRFHIDTPPARTRREVSTFHRPRPSESGGQRARQ
jgi:HSP20 family molecular chaperone IbpA